jgi:hypothetical protein
MILGEGYSLLSKTVHPDHSTSALRAYAQDEQAWGSYKEQGLETSPSFALAVGAQRRSRRVSKRLGQYPASKSFDFDRRPTVFDLRSRRTDVGINSQMVKDWVIAARIV